MGSVSILRRIFGSSSDYSLRCVSRSLNSCCCSKLGVRSMSSNTIDESSSSSSSTLRSRPSPWLMLPPAFEDGNMVYKFYSLGEDKVLSFNKRMGGESVELPDDEAKFVGSSHGWLALFNQRNNDLFLSNPISHRHIKLPPVDTLPDPKINLRDGHGSVSKVILSCSPAGEDKEEGCRAVMSFGPGDRLACCCPGFSRRWSTMGDPFSVMEHPVIDYAVVYEDFVYSSGDDVFACLPDFEMDLEDWELGEPRAPIELEDWVIEDPRSPSLDRTLWLKFGGEKCSWWKENMAHLKKCIQIPYLVYAEEEEEEQLFLLVRFVIPGMAPDGWYDDTIYTKGWNDRYPYKTLGFSVRRVDRYGVLSVKEGSLDGLAMFVGINHSFAISAPDFPGLKPNSIYFTDAHILPPPDSDRNIIYGGHDIGIFDYENKTISSCYHYPCDAPSFQRIVPPPMWFTPSFY